MALGWLQVGIKLLQPMGLESHQDSPQPGELAVRTCRTSTELLFLSPLEDVPPQRLTSNCYDAGRGLTAHSCANPRPNTNWQFTAVAPSSLRQQRLHSAVGLGALACELAAHALTLAGGGGPTAPYSLWSPASSMVGGSRAGVPTRAPAVVSNCSLRLRPASSLVGPVPVCPREHLRSSPTTAYAFDLRAHWLVPSRCAHASTCGRLQLQPTPSTCEITGWSRPGVPTRAPAVAQLTAYASTCVAHWWPSGVPTRALRRLQLQLRLRPGELTGWSRPGVPTRAPAVVSNYSLRLRPARSLVGPVPVCPCEHLRSSPTTAYAFDLRAHWLVPSRCAYASTCGRSNYSLRLRRASSLVGPVPVCPCVHLRSSPTTAYAFDLRAHWLVPSRCAHASTCGCLQLQPTPSTCELTGWSRPGVPMRAPAVVSNYSGDLRPASSLVGPVPVCPCEHLRSFPTTADTCELTGWSRPGVPMRSSPTTAYAFDLRAHWLVPSRCAHASTCGRLQLQPTPSTCEFTGWSRPCVPTRAPAVVSNYSLRLRPASSLVGPVPVCACEHLRSCPTTAYAFDLRAHWLVPSRCAPASTCGRLHLQPTPSTCELTVGPSRCAHASTAVVSKLTAYGFDLLGHGWSRPGVTTRAPAVVSKLQPRFDLRVLLTVWSRPGVPTPSLSTCELTGLVPSRLCNASDLRSSQLQPTAFDLRVTVGPVPGVAHAKQLRRSIYSYAFDLRAHWLVPSRCAHACTCGRLQPQPTPSTCELTGWSRPGVPTRAPAVVSNYSLRLRPASSLVGPVPVCPREHLRSSPTTAYAFDMRAHWLVPSRCAHASTCGRLQLQPTPSTCELIGWSRPGVPTRAPAVVSNYSLRLRPASSLVGPVPVCPREHLRSSPTSAYTCDLRAHWLVPSRCAHASEHLRSSPTTAYAFDLRAHWLVPSRCAHASTCGRLQLQPTPSTCLLTGWSRPGVPTRAPAVVSNYSQRLRPASSLVGPVPVAARCANASTCGRLQNVQLTPSNLRVTVGPVPVFPTRAPAVRPNYSHAFDMTSSLVGPPPCGRLQLQAYAFELRAQWLFPVTGFLCPAKQLRSSPSTAYAFDLRAHWLVPSRCAHASTCGRLQLQPTPSTCELIAWSRPGVPMRAPAVVSSYSGRLRAHLFAWALWLLRDLLQSGLRPDRITYQTSLSICGAALQWWRSLALLAEAGFRGFEANTATYNAVICACDRGEHWEQAFKVLHDMRFRHLRCTAPSLNSARSAAERAGKWQLALVGLLQAFTEPGMTDVVSVGLGISACAASSSWTSAMDLLRFGGILVDLESFKMASFACARAALAAWRWPLHLLQDVRGRRLDADVFMFGCAARSCGSS
ncbi:unnamed protein product, partial [Polarella glacialis]